MIEIWWECVLEAHFTYLNTDIISFKLWVGKDPHFCCNHQRAPALLLHTAHEHVSFLYSLPPINRMMSWPKVTSYYFSPGIPLGPASVGSWWPESIMPTPFTQHAPSKHFMSTCFCSVLGTFNETNSLSKASKQPVP